MNETKRAEFRCSENPSKQNSPIGPMHNSSTKSSTGPFVVDVLTHKLEALVPSIEGDLSAAHVAIVRSLGSAAAAPVGTVAPPNGFHVDQVLRAENAFLDVCDFLEVSSRLKEKAEGQAERQVQGT